MLACWSTLSASLALAQTALTSNRIFSIRLRKLATNGIHAQPKYAATILAYDSDPENTIQLTEHLVDELSAASAATRLAHLNALNRLCKFAITSLASRAALLDDILREDILGGQDGMQVDAEVEEWMDDEFLTDQTKDLVSAIKVYTNLYLAGFKASEDKNPDQFNEPIKYLLKFLDIPEMEKRYSAADASRLRLQAGFSLFKIAGVRELEPRVLQHLDKLAALMQDYCFTVRQRFLHKLGKYMAAVRLANPQFNLLFYITAVDPEAENIQFVRFKVTMYHAT
jgi:hypothetical protein